MERLATLFTGSFRQLKQVKTVTVCAMLGAVAIVLGSLSIELGSTLAYRFSGIPNEIVHMAVRFLQWEAFCRHYGYFKISDQAYGSIFSRLYAHCHACRPDLWQLYYKKELNFWRVLAAHITVALICNVLLNTWCLSILYGKAFAVLLPARLVKNAIMCPIDAFIFYHIAKVLDVTGVFKMIRKRIRS